MQYIVLSSEQVNDLHAGKLKTTNWNFGLNEYVIFQVIELNDNDKPTHRPIGAYRYDGHKLNLVPLTVIDKDKIITSPLNMDLGSLSEERKRELKRGSKFTPLNYEQLCWFDLLNRDEVPGKIAQGTAGSGKTKAALMFAFAKRLAQPDKYKKIVIVREPVGMGKEVGYFKGGKDEKVMEWQAAIKDNLSSQSSLAEWIKMGIVEIDIPKTMQGRDLKNTIMIVDECQNVDRNQFKMLGSRLSEDSIGIFIGDVDQKANTYLQENSGLDRAIQLAGKSQYLGVVTLTDDVRSQISKFFATQF